MSILDTAACLNMPKLLACCEYHFAVGFRQELTTLSLRLKTLPVSSLLRIAEAALVGYQRSDTSSKFMPGPKEFLRGRSARMSSSQRQCNKGAVSVRCQLRAPEDQLYQRRDLQ